MALIADDGGRRVVKTAVPTTGAGTPTGGATSTGASRPSTPALTPTKAETPTASKPADIAKRGGTIFNRRPVVDDNLSLRDAVRTNTKASPIAPRGPEDRPSRPAPASEKRSEKASTTPQPGEPNANDGRAARLNEGNNVGSRDRRIAALKDTKATLEKEEVKIEGQIKGLEDEIQRDVGKSTIVKTGVGIVSAPIGAIASLFGKSNPVADAAGAVTDKLLGLEGDRDELKAQEKELDTQQAEIETEIKKLENEQVLNYMAATARVVDMDDKVIDFIEEGETKVGKLDVKLNVADETGTGSDGAFDSGTNAITVDSDVIADAKKNMDELRGKGIVDGDGNIVDAAAFDQSSAGDDTVKSVSLLGVHELNHASQAAQGEFNSAFESARSIVDDAMDDITPDTMLSSAGNLLRDATAKGEEVRTAAIEVDSYRLQEQNDLRSGATKKAFITIDTSGTPLPEAQQLANALAYQDRRPLEFGPTAGYVRPESSGSSQESAGGADGADAPGFRGPGFRGPGFRGPGEIADGFRGPGFRGPGFRGPGEIADGFRGPGDIADGFRGPGFRGPGDIADGFRGPGFRGPGFRGPGEIAD